MERQDVVPPNKKSPKGKIAMLTSRSTTIFFLFRYWKKRNKEIARLQVERQDVVPPICVSSGHLWTTRCRSSAKKPERDNKDYTLQRKKCFFLVNYLMGLKKLLNSFINQCPWAYFYLRTCIWFVTIIDYRNYKNTSLYSYQSDAKRCNWFFDWQILWYV